MKKTYEGLEMEVIRFSTEDIITTSEAATNNNEQTTTQQQTNNNQTSTQDQTGTNVLAPTQDQTPAQEPTNEVPDGYTATGGSVTWDGKTYPEYQGPDGWYYWNGTEMVGPFESTQP